MSTKSEELEALKKEAAKIKEEFQNEIDMILQRTGAFDDSTQFNSEIQGDKLEEYENRLEKLKEELKKLKKVKKRQEKISKLEEEKIGVIREIERKKEKEKKVKGHNKH